MSLRPALLMALSASFATPVLAGDKQDLFHVDSGVGASWAYGLGAYGMHGVVETKLFLIDELSIGVRVDAGVQVGVGIQTGGDATSVETVLNVPVATQAKVEYFLGKDGFRPFVGVGAGMYLLVLQSVSAGAGGSQLPAVYQGVSQHFGVAPQIGLDFGGVRLAATYNYILGGELLLEQTVGNPTALPRDYIGVELTFKSFGWHP